MKSPILASSISSLVLAAFLAAPHVSAATVSWDSDGIFGDGTIDGGGAWDLISTNWGNGSADNAWANGNNDIAVFGDGGTGGATAVSVTLAAGINVGGLTFNSSSTVSNYTITGNVLILGGTTPTITTNVDATIASVLAGTTLTKAGAGALTLTAANSYTGVTTISAGTLQLGDGVSTNGSVAGNITDSAGATLTFANPAAQSYAGVISGAGAMTKTGAGTLTLSSGQTYTGGTTVNAGSLVMTGGGGSGGNLRGTLTINSGATVTETVANGLGYGGGTNQVTTLNINGGTFNTTAAGDQGWGLTVNLTGGTLESNNGTSSATTTALFSMGNNFTINSLASATTSVVAGRVNLREANTNTQGNFVVADGPAATDLLVSAVITGAASTYGIVKNGPGLMKLTAANTYTGTTTVNNGTLELAPISAGTALVANASVVVNSGGTLQIDNTNATPQGTSAIDVTLAGGTYLSTNATAGANTGEHVRNLNFTAGGAFTTAANVGSYQGYDVVLNGTLTVSGTAAGTINMAHGIGITGSHTFNVADVTGSAAPDLTIVSGGLIDTGTGGGGSATGTLVKTGAGTLQLNGATNTVGTVSINAGTLALSGTAGLSSGSITVASGGTFDVSGLTSNYALASGQSLTVAAGGLLNGNATLNSGSVLNGGGGSSSPVNMTGNLTSTGSINPGGAGAAGTFTINGGLALNGGAVNFDLGNVPTAGSGVNDLVSVGNLTLNGTTSIVVSKLNGALASGTYTLFNYSGSLTGGLSNLALAGSLAGTTRQTFTLGTTGSTNGSVILTVAGSSASLTWAGDGTANAWDLATTSNFLNGGSRDKYYDGDDVTFADGGSNSPAIAITGALLPNSLTVNNSATAYTFGGTGSIGGATGITKLGNGTLTIANTNSFTGAVSISKGVVSVGTLANGGTNSALGSGTAISLGDSVNTGDLQYTGLTASTNRALTLNPGGGIVEVTNAGSSLTASGIVSGTGAFSKSGPGTLIFTGANTYSGTTTVNGGTLQIGSGTAVGSLGSGPVTVGASGTLAFLRSDNGLTIANNLSGSGSLVFNGTGVSSQSSYTLSGNNAGLTGSVTANNARIILSGSSVIGTASLAATNGGQYYLTGGTFTNNFTLAGTGWLETAGRLGAMRLLGATINGNIALTGATTISAYSSSGIINGAIMESGGSQNLALGVTGSASTLTLNGASTYTGTTTITNANVTLNGSLGNTAVTVTDGATFSGHGSIGGSLTLGSSTGAAFVANAQTPGALSVGNLVLTGTDTVTLTAGSALPMGTPYTLINYSGTLTGSATNLTLANSSNYRQAVFSAGGGQVTLDIGAKALTWTGSPAATWDLNTTSSWNDSSFTAQKFFAADAVTFDDSSSSSVVAISGTVAPSSATFNNSATNYTFTGGNISGGGSLTKNGTGCVTFNEANSLTGPVVINAGTVNLSSTSGVFNSSSGVTINSGAQIVMLVDNTLGFTTPVMVNAGGVITTGANAAENIGPITLAGGTVASATPSGDAVTYGSYLLSGVNAIGTSGISVMSAQNMTLPKSGGVVFNVSPGAPGGVDLDVTGTFVHATGTTDNGLVKTGAGVMQLDGLNTYTGATVVNAGILQISSTGGLSGSALTVNTGGTLINSGTIAGGSTKVAGGSLIVQSGGTVSNALTVTSGSVLVSGTLSGSTATVSGGSLTFDNPASVSNAITVNGGTVAGNGVLLGAVTINSGGTFAPGGSNPGIFSLANSFTLNTGGHLAIDAAAPGSYDQMLVASAGAGNVTLGGDLQLTLGYTPAVGDIFYIIVNGGSSSVSGTFSNAVPQSGSTGLLTIGATQFLVSYAADFAGSSFTGGQDVALEVIAVPEPASSAMLFASLGALVGLQRFRRRR